MERQGGARFCAIVARGPAAHPAPCYAILLTSEDPAFAELCESQGIVFVGPTSSQLALFGDKTRARALARSLGVPLLPGTSSSASLSDVSRFASSLPNDAAVILKAVAGGGGRGMRVVRKAEGQDALRAAYESCEREAQAAFGDARLYAERYLEQARHVEVQIVGDGTGEVAHLWERECSLQRRHQKLVEIAPSPSISPALRKALLDAAMKMAREGKYRSLGTFEFLVPAHNSDESANLFFMEANPRIQVEHTVTEEITHLDLVALQLGLALGASLSSLGLGPNCPPLPFPSSTAIQVRINAESFTPNGEARPESGAVTAFVLPTGRNVRVDTAAHAPLPPPAGANSESGPIVFTPNPAFDSLLAKMIVSGPSYEAARALAARALAQTHIRGTRTNRNFLRALLAHENVVRNDGVHTAFLQARFEQLFEICQAFESEDAKAAEAQGLAQPGTQGDAKSDVEQRPEGTEVLFVEMTGLIVSLDVHEGQEIQAQQQVALIEAMKMEHVIRAPQSGTIVKILLHKGSPVQTGQAIFFYKPSSSNDNDDGQPNSIELDPSVPLDHVRPDLRALQMRKKLHTDEARPEAVRRRHGRGHRTARENLKDLVDPDSFIELGDLALAAQRGRMSEERLMKQTPGDGVM